MKKTAALFSLLFGASLIAQSLGDRLDSLGLQNKNLQHILDSQKSGSQAYKPNSGYKKEINYFSKYPFGENTIGVDHNMPEKTTFVESLLNIFLNSKNK